MIWPGTPVCEPHDPLAHWLEHVGRGRNIVEMTWGVGRGGVPERARVLWYRRRQPRVTFVAVTNKGVGAINTVTVAARCEAIVVSAIGWTDLRDDRGYHRPVYVSPGRVATFFGDLAWFDLSAIADMILCWIPPGHLAHRLRDAEILPTPKIPGLVASALEGDLP